MSNYEYNPLKGVREHTEDNNAGFIRVPCPKEYKWEMQDLSSNGAGRTEDNKMQKQRSGQLEKITVKWKNLTTAEVSLILRAFNPEYVDVIYLSPFDGEEHTAEFYVGDRSVPVLNTKRRRWESLGFTLTARYAEVKEVKNV